MVALYLLLGLLAGVCGGLFGIGGGSILIPIFVYILGFSQHQAQGTTLAIMIPPIGLLAALKYYWQGNVKLSIAIFVCIGFFIGGLLGAELAHKINEPMLKKIFGLFLLLIATKMIIGK